MLNDTVTGSIPPVTSSPDWQSRMLYPMLALETLLPLYPKLKLELLADFNHYEMFLNETAAEKVAQIIYGGRA